MDKNVLEGIIIGLLIAIPYNAFRLYMFFKHGKEIKTFNGLSLFAILLGIIYGFSDKR